MCGIAGLITKDFNIEDALNRAHNVQSHRGPNNQSSYIKNSEIWNIGLAHQRLSIIDLKDESNQPMFHNDQGIIIFNGEIYNYLEIKDELIQEGYNFKTNSDTEVLLVCLHHFGIEQALDRLNGMWSFIWYNIQDEKIYMCRDRMGVKPLHYYINGDNIFFSSEIKTILEMSGDKFGLNLQKVGEYLVQSLLATNEDTFFEGIYRLKPGTYAEFDLTSSKVNIDIKEYWSLKIQEESILDEEKTIQEIRDILTDSIKLRLRSDVPVGVLLSGGIDSSAITAISKEVLETNSEGLNIFSAVSDNKKYDESHYIDLVANHLNISVNKVNLDFGPEEAVNLLDKVNWHNDEPVGSFSNVAHYLLMRKAHELGITVILSGQGADEILCGYRKYVGFYIQQLVSEKRYSLAIKKFLEFKRQGTVVNQFTFREAKRYLPNALKSKEINILGEKVKNSFTPVNVGIGKNKEVRARQIADVRRFSVPVLTHYEDRMSMAWSREIRVPFLDYRLVEKLVSLPIEYKLKNGWTKYILRKAIEPILPSEIVWRKDKQGFINPESEWLKNDLRQKLVEVFNNDSLIYQYGLINKEALLTKYEKYCNQPEGKGEVWFKDIFTPFALESWLKQYEKYLLQVK